MTSTATIHRRGTKATGPSGDDVWSYTTPHVGTPFRLAGSTSGDGGSRSVTIGGVTYEKATAVGHLPADTTNLRDGDLIEVTAGEWAGSVFRIVEAVKKDQATARRVPVEEVARPEGI